MPFLDEMEMRRRMARHTAWHRQELTDGPLVMMTSIDPAARAELVERHRPADETEETLVPYWTDPRQVLRRYEESAERTTFFGDSVPVHFVNLGPGCLAGFMGCRSRPQLTTMWQEPLIDDWATAPELKLHEDNFWWRACQTLTRQSAGAARGRWITSMTDIGGAMDVTSYFRTPEKLCFDLIEHPQEVHASEMAVLKAWFEVYDRLFPVLMAQSGGVSSWMQTWYEGRAYPMQCDFSCMISPAMFNEFVLPMLQRQAAGLEVGVYHLDGPGAIRHLESICTVPNIRHIQWTPGEGNTYEAADWVDLYRRVLKLGRGLLISCNEAGLDVVFDKLDPDQTAMWLGAGDRAGCERAMKKLDRLRAKRKRPV